MKPLRIAFVSSRPSIRRFREDGAFVYRCENLALALSHLGHKTNLLHLTALLFRRDFDVVVFLRPMGGRIYDYVTRRLRAKGVTLVGDVDDLIFNPEFVPFWPVVKNNPDNPEMLQDNRIKFMKHGDALSKLDKVVVSTPNLEKHYKDLHPDTPCAIIPNASHLSWLDHIPSPVKTERSISYFSGTRSHDHDFAIVQPVLKRLLDRHEDLKVRIVGPLSTDLEHPRVIRIPKAPFQEYAQLVRNSHISIAPLEDTPFNQCKSAVKALEAGLMNVPVVASPVGDYARMNVKGVLLANSEEEWEAKLEFLLQPDNYKDASEGLRERILEFSDINHLAHKFLEFTEN